MEINYAQMQAQNTRYTNRYRSKHITQPWKYSVLVWFWKFSSDLKKRCLLTRSTPPRKRVDRRKRKKSQGVRQGAVRKGYLMESPCCNWWAETISPLPFHHSHPISTDKLGQSLWKWLRISQTSLDGDPMLFVKYTWVVTTLEVVQESINDLVRPSLA